MLIIILRPKKETRERNGIGIGIAHRLRKLEMREIWGLWEWIRNGCLLDTEIENL